MDEGYRIWGSLAFGGAKGLEEPHALNPKP